MYTHTYTRVEAPQQRNGYDCGVRSLAGETRRKEKYTILGYTMLKLLYYSILIIISYTILYHTVVLLRGVGTPRYLFHQMHMCSGSLVA